MDVTKIVYLVLSLTFSSILFFVVTPWVFSDLNEHRLKKSTKTFSKKESIVLVDGTCDFGNSNTINTSNSSKNNYIDIPPSINKEGGIEFSYTFWLKLDDALSSEVVLFTKGMNPKPDTLEDKFSKVYDKNDVIDNNIDKLIMCPMVKASTDKLTVKFNTAKKIHNEVVFDINTNLRNIIISSQNNPRWFLFTITFKEGNYQTEYGMNTKGVIVNLYVNEQHVQNKFIENDTININNGNVYIFPDSNSGVNDCKIGNIYYYNWTLNAFEVESIFVKGPNTKTGCAPSGSKIINPQFNSLTRSGARILF